MHTTPLTLNHRLSLPITNLDGVDSTFAAHLSREGIRTIGDLASLTREITIDPIGPIKLRKLRTKARMVAGLRPWLEPFQGLSDYRVSELLEMLPSELANLNNDPAVTEEVAIFLQNQLLILGVALQTQALQNITLSQLGSPESNYSQISAVAQNLDISTSPYAPRVLFVNPTTGDDTQTGNAEHPIATLHEAAKRASTQTVDVTVELAAGTHVLFDHASAGHDGRTLFHGNKRLKIRGEARNVGQAVSVTGAAGNVLTVGETLVPNAHIGHFISLPLYESFPPMKRWIIANGTNDITLAASVSGFGGYFDLPTTGTFEIQELATKIVSPESRPRRYENRLFYQGVVEIQNIHFDQTQNGGFAGPTSLSSLSSVTIYDCKFSGWRQCLNAGGESTVFSCWFEGSEDGEGYGYGSFGFGMMSGDTVFKNLTAAIKNDGKIVLGAGNVGWDLGCFLYVESDGGIITDFSTRIWIDSGFHAAPNYVRMDGRGAQYAKLNEALTGIAGHNTLNNVYQSDGGNTGWSLLNSHSVAVNASRAFIATEDVTLTYDDYVSGATFGSPLRYNDDRGNFFVG